MNFSLRGWLGYHKWRLGQLGRQVAYRLPLPGSKRFIRSLWDDQAEQIHQQWGELEHDYTILSKLLRDQKPRSILDVGCGSGRLFKLYIKHNIPSIIGVDISERALAIARTRFPQIMTKHGRLEDLNFAANQFDLAICNRVLQHIPPYAIQQVVTTLCTIARTIYVNELTPTDNLPENFYMVTHPYPVLFAVHGYTVQEEGQLGEQKYQIYTHSGHPT